jgi:NTP pyrophosphatase (non-canonical NTP hydrolase)
MSEDNGVVDYETEECGTAESPELEKTEPSHVTNERNLINITASTLTLLAKRIFRNNVLAGWWSEDDILDSKFRPNGKHSKSTATLLGSKLALVHSEVSEALEGMRKGLRDDHLPHREMMEVELADAVIRIFDIAGFLGYDIGAAIEEKLEYNSRRADHKIENRIGAGGKTI